MEHELKTWPHAFEAVNGGEKTFEVRSNVDRDFAAGDVLALRKWDPSEVYTGEIRGTYIRHDGVPTLNPDLADTLRMRVTYILHGGRFGLPAGMCVMAIVPDEVA